MSFYEKVKDQVSNISQKYSYKDDGTAFGHFAIRECFNKIIDFGYDGVDLDDYIKQHVVDMANDLGNDVIFTDKKLKRLYMFQFKFSESNLLNTEEIKKNKRFLDWILNISQTDLVANYKLRNIIDTEISEIINEQTLENKDYEIILYYVDNNFNNKIKTDIKALFNNYRDLDINLDVKFYDYNDLEILYDDIEIPKNNVNLDVVPGEYFTKKLTYFDEEETSIETIVTSIKAGSLKKLIDELKEMLFTLNVRYYKGENEINSKIKQEYSKGKRSNFWILNNGINAVCQDFDIVDNDKLNIKNLQIVNGGQTTKTLTKIVNDIPDELHILMRLTKIRNNEKIGKISKDIAIASNSQNAIAMRDLHSGDRIQNTIFKKLDNVGIFYDKKDGEWATVNKRKYKNPNATSPMYLKIKNSDIAKSYMSFFLQIPISTKGRDKLVFSDLYYDEIFDSSVNEDNQFYKLIFAYRLSEKINDVKTKYESKFEILQNSYINDVLVALSALYFIKNDLIKIKKIENIKEMINEGIEYKGLVDDTNLYSLVLNNDFDDFINKIIKSLDMTLEVLKQAKEFNGEQWLPKDTANFLKKDSTYSVLVEKIKNSLIKDI